MSIKRIGTKDKQGIYEITIERGFDDKGIRRRIKRRFVGSKKEAEDKELELKNLYFHKQNTVNKIKNISFSSFCDTFLQKYNKPITEVTKKGYKQMMKTLCDKIGVYDIKNITTLTIDETLKSIKYKNKNKPLAEKSMLHYYELLMLLFNQALKWNYVDNNPVKNATRPSPSKQQKDCYDEDEIIQLITCAKNEPIKNQICILIPILTGMRKGELCGLVWQDIDFTNKTLTIDNSLKVVDGKVYEDNAKTDSSVRTIYIGDGIIKLFEEYKKWQNDYKTKMGSKWIGDKVDRILTDRYGRHMHPDSPYKIFKNFLKKYGLRDITFHMLRNTNASYLNSKGVDPKTVASIEGHATPIITYGIYINALDKSKKDAANIIDLLFQDSYK